MDNKTKPLSRIANLKQRITDLEMALDWYAQKEHYEDCYFDDSGISSIESDRGERARKVLNEHSI